MKQPNLINLQIVIKNTIIFGSYVTYTGSHVICTKTGMLITDRSAHFELVITFNRSVIIRTRMPEKR